MIKVEELIGGGGDGGVELVEGGVEGGVGEVEG